MWSILNNHWPESLFFSFATSLLCMNVRSSTKKISGKVEFKFYISIFTSDLCWVSLFIMHRYFHLLSPPAWITIFCCLIIYNCLKKKTLHSDKKILMNMSTVNAIPNHWKNCQEHFGLNFTFSFFYVGQSDWRASLVALGGSYSARNAEVLQTAGIEQFCWSFRFGSASSFWKNGLQLSPIHCTELETYYYWEGLMNFIDNGWTYQQ